MTLGKIRSCDCICTEGPMIPMVEKSAYDQLVSKNLILERDFLELFGNYQREREQLKVKIALLNNELAALRLQLEWSLKNEEQYKKEIIEGRKW